MEIQEQALDDLMMAQQPIYDRQQRLFGYELLFRGESEHCAVFDNAEAATSQVLVNLCIGITALEPERRQPFFINMTTDLVVSDAFFPISPETVYIEILEDQEITPEFIAAVERWHRFGFRFVLDDYQFKETYDPLLPFMSMVKIDVLATPPRTVLSDIKRLQSYDLALVAEKVEDEAMFNDCLGLGFQYFQGYYLQRPQIVKGKRVKADEHSAVRLLNVLQKDDVEIERVASIVGQNPTLAYQMLRLLNSPVVGLARRVESIKEAVVYLGLTQIRRWATLITLSAVPTHNVSILRVLLIRARCCELLAQKSSNICSDKAFTVGLMSGLDLMLGINQKELMGQIMLHDDLKSAILEHKGPLGKLLYSAKSIEEERWDRISVMPAKIRGTVNHAFFDSLQWANKIIDTIN
ncbi:EAL and HDOD domain-containing protein [Marinomonas ostreistagni]|uniref:EAL and HDOD domain-containing protein n=1 Tax=Marinomonas ostreistagni TaxID=359209 RepID=UPI00194EE55B|nr:HDOD domain-containing protein [Marinomonas ostreistagni]MBM6551725.1 HDOD domain-containing protein [Marinomonas ostreistagni]